MGGKWNLDTIYTGFASTAYTEDLDRLRCLSEKIRQFTKQEQERQTKDVSYEAVKNILKDYLRWMEAFWNLYSRLYSYASLRVSAKVNDREAAEQGRRLELLSASLTSCEAFFCTYVNHTAHVAEICKNEAELKTYEFYIQKIIEGGRFRLSAGEEEILAVMPMTGSKAWSRLQTDISSRNPVTVPKPGESREGLKNRFLAEQEGCKSYAGISAAALNHIKGEVLFVSQLRGYESPLHKTLEDCHMDRAVLDSLLGSIEEYLPKLRRYYKIKAEALGYKEGLPYYERETSIVSGSRTFEVKEARRLILNAFQNFSGSMYDFGKKAFDENWIDFEPAAGKASGASCDGIYAVKESRIRIHYNNTLSDVNTLAHELGHGYHNLNLFGEAVLNNCYDLPIAETASKFSEILLKEELKKELSGREKLYLDDFILSGFVNTLVDIQSRFYFEDEFFSLRKKRELSAEEINELMKKAQEKSYGDALDKRYLHPYMWLNKPHYYFPERNYYNFPYSFGTLLSIGMYRHYKADTSAFIPKYDLFLQSTGKMKVRDLCNILGIDIESRDFWRASLQTIADLVDAMAIAIAGNNVEHFPKIW